MFLFVVFSTVFNNLVSKMFISFTHEIYHGHIFSLLLRGVLKSLGTTQ